MIKIKTTDNLDVTYDLFLIFLWDEPIFKTCSYCIWI